MVNPDSLIGKNVFSITDRFDKLGVVYRVANFNGLITADYMPNRYTLVIDTEDNIVSAYLG